MKEYKEYKVKIFKSPQPNCYFYLAITINWITKYLYWTNQNGDIMSANTKGSEVKPLLKSVQGLFGITVNPFTK